MENMNPSSSSLLGLLSQLQSLESKFANVLMESVLKLSILSEASIFILIETPEGRQFSGKDHLCDAFNRGILCNSGSDIELEVDPNLSSLRPKIIPNAHPVSLSHSSSNSTSHIRPSGHLLGRKRSLPANSSPSQPTSTPMPMNGSPSKQIKFERPTTSPMPHPSNDEVDQDLICIDEDEDDVTRVFGDDLTENDPNEMKPVVSSSSSSSMPHWQFTIDNDSINSSHYETKEHHKTVVTSWMETDFSLGNKKMAVIKVIDGTADLTKNSTIRKVLDSLLYDVGCVAAAKCPFLNLPFSVNREQNQKSYLSQVFESLCQQFDHMDELENYKIEYSNSKLLKFKVYVRMKLSMNFCNCLKKLRA